MREPRNIRENQSLKAQGLPYRFPKTIGGVDGEIESEWETHTVEYHAEWDAYGFNLDEMAIKGSGIATPLIYRKVGETYTELQELPLSTLPPISFYCIDYHGTGFESTSRVYMHEDTNGWEIVVKRYAGLGRVQQYPRKTGFVYNALKVGGSVIGNETAYAGATIAREQLALKEIITEDVNRRFTLIEHGITNGKSRIISWCSHYRPAAPKFRDVSFIPRALNAQKWYGGNPNGSGLVSDDNSIAADFRSIAYGNGTWVAVATPTAGSTSVYTSLNGIAWTRRTASAANNWTSVGYGNGWFVAVSSNGTNRVMRSQDGISWVSASAAEANLWNGIATDGAGTWIAVSSTGTNRAMVSTDNGATWTASNIGSRSWTGVAYGGSVWVAVASGYLKRSTDNGGSWGSETAAGVGLALSRRVSYGQGYFVAVAYNAFAQTLSAYRSADGSSWGLVSVSAGPDSDTLDICSGMGLHAIVESTSLFTSSDGGATWTPYPGPLNNVGTSGAFGVVREIAFGQSAFVKVGGSGSLAWTERNFADDSHLSIYTDINDEAPDVNREVYTYILYKQAGA
jgi:hypothetical protein